MSQLEILNKKRYVAIMHTLIFSHRQTQLQAMSTKSSSSKPWKQKSQTQEKQRIIVHEYIRQAFASQNLRKLIIPNEIINIIYAYVTFRDYISLALIGPTDSGKSTLGGRILHELGVISDEDLGSKRKLAADLGKEDYKYAFLLDKTRDERDRGITILGSAKYYFNVGTSKFALIDVPSNRYTLYTSENHTTRHNTTYFKKISENHYPFIIPSRRCNCGRAS